MCVILWLYVFSSVYVVCSTLAACCSMLQACAFWMSKWSNTSESDFVMRLRLGPVILVTIAYEVCSCNCYSLKLASFSINWQGNKHYSMTCLASLTCTKYRYFSLKGTVRRALFTPNAQLDAMCDSLPTQLSALHVQQNLGFMNLALYPKCQL